MLARPPKMAKHPSERERSCKMTTSVQNCTPRSLAAVFPLRGTAQQTQLRPQKIPASRLAAAHVKMHFTANRNIINPCMLLQRRFIDFRPFPSGPATSLSLQTVPLGIFLGASFLVNLGRLPILSSFDICRRPGTPRPCLYCHSPSHCTSRKVKSIPKRHQGANRTRSPFPALPDMIEPECTDIGGFRTGFCKP